MKYFYGEYDGEEFPTQENLFGFDQMMEFIMEYGDQAMKALEQMTACWTRTARASCASPRGR
jgi:hypothetical protein